MKIKTIDIMSKEDTIFHIMEIYKIRNRITKNSIYEYNKRIDNYSLPKSIIYYFGSFSNMYKELNLNQETNIYNLKKKKIDKNDVIKAIDDILDERGYLTGTILAKYKKLNFNYVVTTCYNGKYSTMYNELNLCKKRIFNNNIYFRTLEQNYTKEKLIKQLNYMYNDFVNFGEFGLQKFNPIIIEYIKKYFDNFNNMCIELNFNIEKYKKLTYIEVKEEIYKIFNIAKYENIKFTKCFLFKESNIPRSMIEKIIKKNKNYMEDFSEIKEYNKRFEITEDMVIKEIFELHQKAIDNNESFNHRYYIKYAKYSWWLENIFFDSYQDAVFKLNLTSNVIPDIDLNVLKQEILNIYNEYGFVSCELIVKKSKYRHKAMNFIYKNYNGINDICKELKIENKELDLHFHEALLIKTIAKILNTENYVREKRFDWLINPKTKHKFRVDAYFEDYNLIVEYNGKQHYTRIDFFHKTEKEFKDGVEQYNNKIKIIKEKKKFKILEWKYSEEITYDSVLNKLKIMNII